MISGDLAFTDVISNGGSFPEDNLTDCTVANFFLDKERINC
jgi:hypothetical protein